MYYCKYHNFRTSDRNEFHQHIMDDHIGKLPESKPYKKSTLLGDLLVKKEVKNSENKNNRI